MTFDRRAKTKSFFNKRGASDDMNHQQALDLSRPGMPARAYSIDQGSQNDPTASYNKYRHHFSEGESKCLFANAFKHILTQAVISRLNCRSLTIGTWRRVACTATDLICYFAQNDPKFTYYINSGEAGFKLQYPIAAVTKIDLKYLMIDGSNELGRATITLNREPTFFMESSPSGEWRQCTDFTAEKQATNVIDHILIGPYEHFKASFTELALHHKETIGLISFEDLSGTDHHGQTQLPSHFRAGTNITNTAPLEIIQAPDISPLPEMVKIKSARTHRRTRSRSAPIAVDFSNFMHQSQTHTGQISPYSYRESNSRPTSAHLYNLQLQEAAMSIPSYDYNESLYTPTTSTSQNYNDTWYTPSYANTPLLESEHSQLASPLIPTGFEQSSMMPGDLYHNPFQMMPNGAAAPMMQMGAPSQSMPNLAQLDTVPEVTMTDLQHQHFTQPLPLGMLEEALDISEIEFADMTTPIHLNGQQARMN